jgi:hypothetical protein
LIGALLACGAPISNQPFLDEALFLGSLPSAERLGAPNDVLLAPNGGSPVLARAKIDAAVWQAWWGVAIATGEELRTHPSDERTDAVRGWDPLNVASRLDGSPIGLPADQPLEWWVTARIVEPVEGGVDWTVAIAADRDGDFVDVGAGHDDDGHGTVSWDLDAMLGALGYPPPAPLGQLEADYVDHDPEYDDLRTVSATLRIPLQDEAAFGAAGDTVFGFTDLLQLTDDGLPWPTYTTAVHALGTGGRAEGLIGTDAATLAYATCWDPDGNTVWQGGDPGVTASGDESACPVAAF